MHVIAPLLLGLNSKSWHACIDSIKGKSKEMGQGSKFRGHYSSQQIYYTFAI
jgi:hypothetical protein